MARSNTTLWKYKAYDASGDHSEGVASGSDPQAIVLELRQSGLQVYDMVTVQANDYRQQMSVELKIDRLRKAQIKALPKSVKQEAAKALAKAKAIEAEEDAERERNERSKRRMKVLAQRIASSRRFWWRIVALTVLAGIAALSYWWWVLL